MRLVKIAAMKPNILKLISNELHKASPSIIGINETLVQKLVTSPIKILEIITVKSGDELLMVSTNETAACFNAIRPRTSEKSLFITLKQFSYTFKKV